MKTVYLFSGLGADKRVFEFLDFQNLHIKHIDWITPLSNESVEEYARRLSTQITTNNPILLGVSFGGMIALEIAKQISCEKIILISSAETKYDIPFYFRCAGTLHLHKLIPACYFKKVNSLTYWMFGTETKAERYLLSEIIKSTDEQFLKWAIHKIVSWKNITTLPNRIKIHGTSDRILPSKKANYLIKDSGHFMIVSRAIEISAILKKELA